MGTGFLEVISIWYQVNRVVKQLVDDCGVMEMVNWTKYNGKVHM